MYRNLLWTSISAALVVLVLLTALPAAAAVRTHVVQPGETLYRIALEYGVTVDAIAEANHLADPARISPGQVLTIPETGARERGNTGTRNTAKIKSTITGAQRNSAETSAVHVVQPGDTLYAIARRFGTTVGALMNANRLRTDALQVGQHLVIPGPVPARGAKVRSAAPVVARVTPIPAPAAPPPAASAAVAIPFIPPVVGSDFVTSRPLRVRRGPRTYHTTLAIVATDTPLRILSEESGWYEVQLPTGDVGYVHEGDFQIDLPAPPVPPELVHGADIVTEAMRYLGTPYVWGGESSRGMDCSGFIYIVFATRVPGLARTSTFEYYQMGVAVDRASLLPGDLVFFTTYARGPSHVGIYVGDGKFVHASSGARRVTVSSLDEPYYSARYLGARRLVKP